MNIEEVRAYCVKKDGVSEGFPFDETTLVFKVMNKMFALLNLDEDHFINLKCDPEIAVRLREEYSFVSPGYHMNKQNWNSVKVNDLVPADLLCKWIDDSYNLIVSGLTKKKQEELKNLGKNGKHTV